MNFDEETEYENLMQEYIETDPTLTELIDYYDNKCNPVLQVKIERYIRDSPETARSYEFLESLLRNFELKLEHLENKRFAEKEVQSVERSGLAQRLKEWLSTPLLLFSDFALVHGTGGLSKKNANRLEFFDGIIYGTQIEDAETEELSIDIFTKEASLLGAILVLGVGDFIFRDIFRPLAGGEFGLSFVFTEKQRRLVKPHSNLNIVKIIPYDEIRKTDIDNEIYKKIISLQQSKNPEDMYLSELLLKKIESFA